MTVNRIDRKNFLIKLATFGFDPLHAIKM